MQVITFKDDDHFKFYVEAISRADCSADTYREAFLYLVGLVPTIRFHIDDVYDFDKNCPKLECLLQPWQSPGTLSICRYALNLYNGFNKDIIGSIKDPENAEYVANTTGDYTPYNFFAHAEAPYMIEALKIRYRHLSRDCSWGGGTV